MARLNKKDIVVNKFYQLPKAFFWKDTYRTELSSGAKLTYMLILDRINLSMDTVKRAAEQGVTSVYEDDNGDIYCIIDHAEIEFTLNASNRSVINYIQELVDIGLIDKEKTEGGANHYYLHTLDVEDASLTQFLAKKDYYSHVKARKKKSKKPQFDLDYFMKKREEEHRRKTPKQGVKNCTPSGEGNTSPGGEQNVPPSGEVPAPAEGQNVHPKRTEGISTDSKDTDSKDLHLQFPKSNEGKQPKNEEEEIIELLKRPHYIYIYDQAREIGYNQKDCLTLIQLVSKEKLDNLLTQKIIDEAFRLVGIDYTNGYGITNIAKWTAGKIKIVATNKGNNLAFPITRKKTNGRKEMNPDWIDKPKEDPKPAPPELKDRIKKLKEKIGQD